MRCTRRFRPELESLETRVVPAAYYWRGLADTSWGVAANFHDGPNPLTANPHTDPPGANDIVTLDGVDVDDCITGTVTEVGGLIIQSGYTGTITLLDSKSLTVNNNFEMYGGRIFGGEGTELGQLSTLNAARWEVGTLDFSSASTSAA